MGSMIRRRFLKKTKNDLVLVMLANAASIVSFKIDASSGTCEYNLNESGWETYTSNNSISLNVGDVLMWRGELVPEPYSSIGQFSITEDVDLSGTPMSLLKGNRLFEKVLR